MTVETTLRRAGATATGAAAAAADGRFTVRPASPYDVPAMEQVEREAFPEQWPPTRFGSEVRKPGSLYLIAASPALASPLPGEPAGAPASAGPVAQAGAGASTPAAVPPPARRPLLALIRRASRIPLASWRRSSRAPATPPSYVAGFLGMWFVVDEAHVISIGVRKSERRRGVGELLLLGAFDAARRRQMKELTLEVRKSNSGAQALYSKYGFREVGLRKKYYVDNGEDAIIMTTPPISTPEFAERLQRLAREHAERWGRAVAYPDPRSDPDPGKDG